jgi:RNA polymerase sigma factor (sigma-70 family)
VTLLVKSLSGSFEAFYRAYAPAVFRRARNLLQSDAEAQDVVSQVFTSLYERPAQFKERSALSTFLYRMTTNACLNRIRNHKTRSSLLERETEVSAAVDCFTADRATLLRELLEKMPEPLDQVAVYYYLDELTHQEIAQILGCSRRHVGDLLVRLDRWIQQSEVLS